MSNHCLHCKHFYKQDPHKAVGQCRLNPPSFMLLKPTPMGSQEINFMFPMVNPDSFCSKYDPKLLASGQSSAA